MKAHAKISNHPTDEVDASKLQKILAEVFEEGDRPFREKTVDDVDMLLLIVLIMMNMKSPVFDTRVRGQRFLRESSEYHRA